MVTKPVWALHQVKWVFSDLQTASVPAFQLWTHQAYTCISLHFVLNKVKAFTRKEDGLLFSAWDVSAVREVGPCGWFHSSLSGTWSKLPWWQEAEHPWHQPNSLDRRGQGGVVPWQDSEQSRHPLDLTIHRVSTAATLRTCLASGGWQGEALWQLWLSLGALPGKCLWRWWNPLGCCHSANRHVL